MIVTDEQVVKAIRNVLGTCDIDKLISIAEHTLGGKFVFIDDPNWIEGNHEKFTFTPDENYKGDFGEVIT